MSQDSGERCRALGPSCFLNLVTPYTRFLAPLSGNRCPFTFSKKYISKVSETIVIKFHVKHHQVAEKAA